MSEEEIRTAIQKREYRIRFTEPMLGTVAMDPEIYKTYIEAKKEKRKDSAYAPGADDEAATVEKREEKGWTGFHRLNPDDQDSPMFVYDYFVKGFLKGSGNVLKDIVKVKQLKSKLDDFVFVFPRRILLGTGKPDGVLERPLRAMTMQGPRVTLARSDYVKEGTEITFQIHLFPHPALSWKLIDALMAHGQYMGMGQFRNGSYGRFEVVDVKEC
jgi:hypothetical protein